MFEIIIFLYLCKVKSVNNNYTLYCFIFNFLKPMAQMVNNRERDFMKNLKKTILSLLMCGVLTFSFTACNDANEETVSSLPKTKEKTFTNARLFEIYNADNPFDVIGMMHNVVCNNLGKELLATYGDKFYETDWGSEEYSSKFVSELNSVLRRESENYDYQDVPDQVLMDVLNSFDERSYLLSDAFNPGSFDAEETNSFFLEMKLVFDDFLSDKMNMEELFSSLTLIENNILKEGKHNLFIGTSLNAYDIALTYISIIKHSLVYWNDAYLNEKNVWHDAYLKTVLYFTSDAGFNYKFLGGFRNALGKIKDLWRKGVDGIVALAVKVVLPVALCDAAGFLIGSKAFMFGPGAVVGCTVGGSALGVITSGLMLNN